MKSNRIFSALIGGGLVSALLLAGCQVSEANVTATTAPTLEASSQGVAEQTGTSLPPAKAEPVELIRLEGPAAEKRAELSGLATNGTSIWLLPQYPERFEADSNGAIFTVTSNQVVEAVANQSALTPQAVAFDDGGLSKSVAGFDGFEAMAVCGRDVYVTIEVRGQPEPAGYLVRGALTEEDGAVALDPASLTPLPAPVKLDNHSYEADFCTPDNVVALYEANGRKVNAHHAVLVFDRDLNPMGSKAFPPLEYRVTDATQPDQQGNFWVMNYFFTGDKQKLKPEPDAWIAPSGQSVAAGVERLIKLHWSPETGIQLTDKQPLWLQKSDQERNWEGAVVVGDEGILLVTDSFPQTLLGFVRFTR